MADIQTLTQLRQEPFFPTWEDSEFVTPEQLEASRASLWQLIDQLLEHGADLTENQARTAVEACVERFNHLDEEGWIETTEREDIFEEIGRIVDACGFAYDEDWISARDW
jgi:hypothetical protein